MAATGVDGTMYNVAPTGVNALAPPTLDNTVTTVSIGNGATTIETSPTLPAGTYLVGGNMSIASTTTFTASDTLVMRIRDGAGSLTNFPQVTLTGYSGVGSTPSAVASTPTGVIVLATSGTIIWDANCSFTTATGKSATLGSGWYQRIA